MQKTLINGKESTHIDVRDRGLQYGDGVFETIACRAGQLELWPLHMQRLESACLRLSLPLVDPQLWLNDIAALELKSDAVIKLSITRGVSARGYAFTEEISVTRVCTAYALAEFSPHNQQGITAIVCDTPVSANRALAGVKHLNRLDNVLARNEWKDSAIAEGIMLDENQHVIEGTMSNVFAVTGNEIYTPVLDQSGVQGVMRDLVIELAESLGIKVNIIEISRQNLLNMDEIFITNSLIGIWPVVKIVDHQTVYDYSHQQVVSFLKKYLPQSISNNSRSI